jgi:signal transduction histidine kinase
MQQTEAITFIIVANILLIGLIAGIILFIIQFRKRKVEHLKEKDMITEIHAKELLSTQLEMQAQTMQHIGREIHDNVGQKLTLASLYTQQLAFENKAPLINDKIEHIGNIINESLSELRQLSKSLTDDRIKDNSIVELLQQECNNIKDLNKCDVVFRCNAQHVVLTYQTKSILLRIVQEFLQNSIKHAECTALEVSLSKEQQVLCLFLKDNGKGFSINQTNSKGIGLANMKKRAALINASFNLASNLCEGTSVQITLNM